MKLECYHMNFITTCIRLNDITEEENKIYFNYYVAYRALILYCIQKKRRENTHKTKKKLIAFLF